ncbi:MAG: hypothetical protein KGZ87_05370 [Bacteroidetes bacterium]|nr:hypothetical protein [Bacteroidota bacterium]
MIQIKNGKVYIEIEGELRETSNPELIGLAVLDFAENELNDLEISLKSYIDD